MLEFLQQDADPETGKFMRRVRSFVLREGRLTHGQAKALEKLWPLYGLTLSQGELDMEAIFGRKAPVILEIGYGMGHSLATMAAASPDVDFIGIEVHRPGVGALLMEVERLGLTNVRTFCDDAVDVLQRCIPQESLHRLQLYFPDPWHKKKHHKRRIVQPEFIDLLHSRVVPNGVLHMATDWEDYAEHMLEVMESVEGWQNTSCERPFIQRPDWRPETKFERRGKALGHGVWDLLYERLL